jgi:hypothetical protein
VNGAALDRDGGARVDRLENLLGIPAHRRLGLVALFVDLLLEVALAVEERHADDRGAEIGGRPQGIAGQNTQPATVRGDRLLEADLHREIGDGRFRGSSSHEIWLTLGRPDADLLTEQGRKQMCA